MKILTLIPVLAALGFAGCSSAPPSYGDQISTRGDSVNAIGKQWNDSNEAKAKGSKMIEKGQRMIDNALKDQTEGEQMKVDGQRMIDESKQKMLDSEADYQKIRANPVPSPVQP